MLKRRTEEAWDQESRRCTEMGADTQLLFTDTGHRGYTHTHTAIKNVTDENVQEVFHQGSGLFLNQLCSLPVTFAFNPNIDVAAGG